VPLNVKQISTKLGHGMFVDIFKRLMELRYYMTFGCDTYL